MVMAIKGGKKIPGLTIRCASQVALVVKEPTCQGRRHKRRGFDPWVRKIPGGGPSNPLQYSCLENPMDRGAWGLQSTGSQRDMTEVT